MKRILAIVLLSAAFGAHAEGFYIGGDLGTVSYPDYTTDTANWLIGNGATYASVTQKVVSSTVDIHIGQWVTEGFGWEAGYADLGSVDGSYASNSGVLFPNGTYTYSAAAAHVAVLGGIPLGRGKLFGKFGLFSASTTLDDPYFSQTVYSTGLLLGGGYEFWFNPAFSLRAGLNLYSGVNFVNEGTYAIESRGMAQVAVGANFTF
jgi:hypothetical protein